MVNERFPSLMAIMSLMHLVYTVQSALENGVKAIIHLHLFTF